MVAMLMFLDVMSECLKLKQEATALNSDIKFRKFMRAYRAKFDPDQPRDARGRWTNDGSRLVDDGGSDPEFNGGEGNGISMLSPFRSSQAAMRRRDECDLQYQQDVFQCKMVGLSQCYAQAMVRRIACERGQLIPPLFYM